MPTFEDLPPGKLMYKDSNDVWCEVAKVAREITNLQLAEPCEDDGSNPEPGFYSLKLMDSGIGIPNFSMSFSLRMPPWFKKRPGRKRTMKLLMALGIQRNDADKMSRALVQNCKINQRSVLLLTWALSSVRMK